MLKEGDIAPDFSLRDKDEVEVSLESIESNFVVLFFYPKDNTPGCTIEAKSFTSKMKDFKKLKTEVIGISGGDSKTKTKFCEKNELDVVLLSDTDFETSTRYGVYGTKKFMGREYLGITRTTFVLDKNKKIVKIFNKVKPNTHVEEVIDFIKHNS